MIKLLRTIRFDDSDTRVFAQAADAGEWAISGAFAFADLEPAAIVGKTKQAFANGFLGLTTFGRATFATVGEATPADCADLELCLARHFVAAYGAPDVAAAADAARAEIAFVASLCVDVAINTVFTVRRVRNEHGAIKEEFRTITPPSGAPAHARVWTVERDETNGA